MRHLIIYCLILLLAGGCSQLQDQVAAVSPLEQFADSLMSSYVDSSKIAGAAIGVIQNGETRLLKSFGYADLEFDVPMPVGASFEIGSITKQFTAVAVLKLVEQGKLSLEDDLKEYLPDFDTKGRNIKIKQLLNHTSGIPSYTEIRDFWDLSIHNYPRDSLLRIIEGEDFKFEPGEAMIYNNSAYFILGLIIEKVSGIPYEEYISSEIFDPLGMDNSYYCSVSKVIKKRAHGYNYTIDGLIRKPYLDHTWPYAAGSLCSTVEDLLIWLKGLHNGEVLSEELYKTLITPDTLNDGTELRYAFGLSNFLNAGYRQISHGGGINGFRSDSRYYPDQDLYIVTLVNTAGPLSPGMVSEELAKQLLEPKDPGLVEFEGDIEAYQGKFTGTSRGSDLHFSITSNGNYLIVDPGSNNQDTLDQYVGDHTWINGSQYIRFVDHDGVFDEVRVDVVSGHYILKKD